VTDARSALESLFLFSGLAPERCREVLALCTPQVIRRKRGEALCTPEEFPRALTLITEGRCDVLQGTTVLNTLHAGDCFGIVSLYSARPVYPTTVLARRETAAILLLLEDIERMVRMEPEIAINMVRFLTGRVEFLEERTATFAEPSVEKRLAAHLLRKADPDGTVTINRKHTAQMLGCGRASLYRALDALEEKHLISRIDGTLRLIDQNELERMTRS